jgi:hypothetical protein
LRDLQQGERHDAGLVMNTANNWQLASRKSASSVPTQSRAISSSIRRATRIDRACGRCNVALRRLHHSPHCGSDQAGRKQGRDRGGAGRRHDRQCWGSACLFHARYRSVQGISARSPVTAIKLGSGWSPPFVPIRLQRHHGSARTGSISKPKARRSYSKLRQA